MLTLWRLRLIVGPGLDVGAGDFHAYICYALRYLIDVRQEFSIPVRVDTGTGRRDVGEGRFPIYICYASRYPINIGEEFAGPVDIGTDFSAVGKTYPKSGARSAWRVGDGFGLWRLQLTVEGSGGGWIVEAASDG